MLRLPKVLVEDIEHLVELEIVVGVERQHIFRLLDPRIRALEIETTADHLVGLVDRVTQVLLVYFGNDIE